MEIGYTIQYLEIVVRKHIPDIPTPIKAFIKTAIETKLMRDPVVFGKPLQHSLKGHRRLRVGDYRIVYRIEPAERIVLIIAIKHRKDVYE